MATEVPTTKSCIRVQTYFSLEEFGFTSVTQFTLMFLQTFDDLSRKQDHIHTRSDKVWFATCKNAKWLTLI